MYDFRIILCVVVTCALRASTKTDDSDNLELSKVFRTPKDFSRVNFDHFEILERNNFDPQPINPSPEDESAVRSAKQHPKSVANAQVMLRIGGDDIKGKNCIECPQKVITKVGQPYPITQTSGNHHRENYIRSTIPTSSPYLPFPFVPPVNQYPNLPPYLPMAPLPSPFVVPGYFYSAPEFRLPYSKSGSSSPTGNSNYDLSHFLDNSNRDHNIANIINVNHPSILQPTDLTNDIVPETQCQTCTENDVDVPTEKRGQNKYGPVRFPEVNTPKHKSPQKPICQVCRETPTTHYHHYHQEDQPREIASMSHTINQEIPLQYQTLLFGNNQNQEPIHLKSIYEANGQDSLNGPHNYKGSNLYRSPTKNPTNYIPNCFSACCDEKPNNIKPVTEEQPSIPTHNQRDHLNPFYHREGKEESVFVAKVAKEVPVESNNVYKDNSVWIKPTHADIPMDLLPYGKENNLNINFVDKEKPIDFEVLTEPNYCHDNFPVYLYNHKKVFHPKDCPVKEEETACNEIPHNYAYYNPPPLESCFVKEEDSLEFPPVNKDESVAVFTEDKETPVSISVNKETPISIPPYKETSNPSYQETCGEAPISITSDKETPLYLTGNKETPIFIKGYKETPIQLSSFKETPISVNAIKETPMYSSISSLKETPIYLNVNKETPISITSQKESPLYMASCTEIPDRVCTEAPICITAYKENPISVLTNKETPISISANKEAPISIESFKETPISLFSNKETPITITTYKETPISLSANKEIPISVTAFKETPISICVPKKETPISIQACKEQEKPISLEVCNETPITISAYKEAPISLSAKKEIPISISAFKETPIPISATKKETPISMEACKEQDTPILIEACKETPISVSAYKEIPISISAPKKETSIVIEACKEQETPSYIAACTETPISICAENKETPISISSYKETPISLTANKETPISISAYKETPISLAANKETPISISAYKETPISISANKEIPISITAFKETPISISASKKETPIFIEACKEQETPSYIAACTETPISICAENKETPISISSYKETPISLTANKETPISISAYKETPISLAANKETPISISAYKETPISISANKEIPISIIAFKETPISISASKKETPIFIEACKEQATPIYIAACTETPISICAENKETPISISSYKETPISLTANKETPISISAYKETPISLAANKETPISISAYKETPISISANKEIPISITAFKETPISISASKKETPIFIEACKEQETPSYIAACTETPISICAENKETPISISSYKETPISLTANKETPISISAYKETPISLAANKETPISISAYKETPISISAKKEIPISITAFKETPISISDSKKETPIFIEACKEQETPSYIAACTETPISVCATNKETPISISSYKETPISLTATKETPISISAYKETPIYLPACKETPVDLSAVNKEAPICNVPINKESSISITAVKEKPLDVAPVDKETPISIQSIEKEMPIYIPPCTETPIPPCEETCIPIPCPYQEYPCKESPVAITCQQETPIYVSPICKLPKYTKPVINHHADFCPPLAHGGDNICICCPAHEEKPVVVNLNTIEQDTLPPCPLPNKVCFVDVELTAPNQGCKEVEEWLNNSLVTYNCNQCGKKLLVSYPISENLDVPEIPISDLLLSDESCCDTDASCFNCPCCQLKGFCDCANCQCQRREPSIPYGKRFNADVDSLYEITPAKEWTPTYPLPVWDKIEAAPYLSSPANLPMPYSKGYSTSFKSTSQLGFMQVGNREPKVVYNGYTTLSGDGFYVDPLKHIIYKQPTVQQLICKPDPCRPDLELSQYETPEIYKVVPEYEIVAKEVKPLCNPKLVPTDNFYCSKLPPPHDDKMVCRRQYLAPDDQVLVQKDACCICG